MLVPLTVKQVGDVFMISYCCGEPDTKISLQMREAEEVWQFRPPYIPALLFDLTTKIISHTYTFELADGQRVFVTTPNSSLLTARRPNKAELATWVAGRLARA